MNRKEKAAIQVLNNFKKKFDNGDDWFEDTLCLEGIEYSKRYFGPDNSFAGTFGIVAGSDWSDAYKKEVSQSTIDAMISSIENVGLYHNPKKNILSNLSPEFLYTIGLAILGLGFFFGQLWEKFNQSSIPTGSSNSAYQNPKQEQEAQPNQEHDSIWNIKKDTVK